MIVFCDRGCPFAHRVHAFMVHLGRAYEVRESDVGEKPEGLEQHSACGRIPLLVHEDLVLTQSRVILEHLAEHFDFRDAYPTDLATRSRQRDAMALVDDFLVPRLVGKAELDARKDRLHDVLEILERAAQPTPSSPSLLTFHVAPIWLRFRWWHPTSAVTRAIEARPSLHRWLEAATELDCLSSTAPDRATQAEDLARAQKAGLWPPEIRRPA